MYRTIQLAGCGGCCSGGGSTGTTGSGDLILIDVDIRFFLVFRVHHSRIIFIFHFIINTITISGGVHDVKVIHSIMQVGISIGRSATRLLYIIIIVILFGVCGRPHKQQMFGQMCDTLQTIGWIM